MSEISEIIFLDTHIWIWLINSNVDQFLSSWLEHFELKREKHPSGASLFNMRLVIRKSLV